MADDKDKKNGQEYDLDEILAEYGSGKYKAPKVVDFPTQKLPVPPTEEEEEDAPQPPVREVKKPVRKAKADEPIPEIVPENVGRTIGARLHTLLRRADHFADHMYDHAVPDKETRKAEKYTPGVDREEPPKRDAPPPRRPRLRVLRPRQLPPDTPPAKLAAQYQKGLKGQGVRLKFAALTAIAAVLCSVELPFLPWGSLAGELAGLEITVFQLRCWVLSALLLLTGPLCFEIVAAGAKQLFTLRPRGETLLLLAWFFTLLDGLTAPGVEGREGFLPFSAVTALGLAFALRGEHERRRGDRLSAKAASQARSPYVVSLADGLWSGRPTYTKSSGSPLGFGSQLQMEDGGHAVYRVAAPLLLLGAMLCSVMASAGQGEAGRLAWAGSACFTAVSSWSALLAYALPYRKLAQRLHRVGAALAGWPGAARCGQGGVVVSDPDLFPTGSVTVTQVKVFGDAATEKVVGYTATMLRAMDCGLTRPFHDLLRTHGALYREVSGLEWHEGGASGVIRGQEVLVGTAAYMHLMEVPVPPGHNIKNAVFCAINGQLSGLFVLNYAMSGAVNPSLSALMKAGVAPILATRDPNLIPAQLEQKFKLPVDKMEFPPVDRRLDLSKPAPEEVGDLVALLSREGLGPYCDAVVGGRRLRQAARWGLAFALAGSAVGLCLTFYLTSVGAFASLTAVNFLIFMAAWLVPQLLIANWVNQY
ncbi:MAG: hypothetical protein HDT38_04510 [Clostridiales bacterium]|nr:hypothetical protein [Clostridiales bacterium]